LNVYMNMQRYRLYQRKDKANIYAIAQRIRA
jgi:hypothetical protein